ncbi:MAG: hypothetical protein ABIS50_21805 [Luteolibacter sp.]|uniref:hypothetical protein n=1 Tax=Luteolibacter sp. TaxID=1962973 RepID=UPI0032655066
MSRRAVTKPRPAGHVLVPATIMGSLSLLLVAGLSVLGIMNRLDLLISKMVSHGKLETFPKSLPEWSLWLAAFVFAFGLSFSILSVPGGWRRVMLWLTALVVVAGWAPVLSLAAHAPEIAMPWIATLWSGVCALVYAGNHRMDCDENFVKPATDPSDETR